MGEPMECAECSKPATVLIVHPRLYMTVVPSCGLHGDTDLDVIPVDSPEAVHYTVMHGWLVPRSEG